MIVILIPTLGLRVFEIRRLLDSLNKQTYKDFKVIFINQGEFNGLPKIVEEYKALDIEIIHTEKKGISLARNLGLKKVKKDDIVVIGDDDCWYPSNALSKISQFHKDHDERFIFTKIYDPDLKEYYKTYSNSIIKKISIRKLMSISSIEISFKYDGNSYFDEKFGIGSKYIVGEEVDFLLRYHNQSTLYIPEVTVYHRKKESKDKDENKIYAKGALYAKHFPFIISIVVVIRDLLVKKENNFKNFYKGFIEFKKERK